MAASEKQEDIGSRTRSRHSSHCRGLEPHTGGCQPVSRVPQLSQARSAGRDSEDIISLAEPHSAQGQQATAQPPDPALCWFSYLIRSLFLRCLPCAGMHAEVRGQLVKVHPLLPPWGTPGIELRGPGLAASTSPHSAISLTQYFILSLLQSLLFPSLCCLGFISSGLPIPKK